MSKHEAYTKYEAGTGQPRLIHADRWFRNKWLAALSVLILLPAILLWTLPAIRTELIEWFSKNDSVSISRLLIIFYSLFSILAITLITAGTRLILTARDVFRSRHFPAPGMRVIYNTWVIRGKRAVTLSYTLLAFGILLVISGSSVPVYFHRLLADLLAPVNLSLPGL